MSAWSQLPNDVWSFIGAKLEVTTDRIRFRSVCKTWRSVVRFPQPPWLMLAEDEHNPNCRGFFGLGQSEQEDEVDAQEVYQFEVPELYRARCVGSTGTWVITIDLRERICAINPFSRVQIDLPGLRALEYGPDPDLDLEPEELRDGFIWKIILSSSPSSSSDRDCIAMIIHHCNRKLAVARPADASWATVQTPIIQFADAIFYKNQFYAVNVKGMLVACDFGNHPTATMLTDAFKQAKEIHKLYLVEWKGELLLVIKIMYDDNDTETYHVDTFEAYIFDFNINKWNEFNNFGEYSLFLGFNTSVAILATQYPHLKPNCIYFTDDYMYGYVGFGIPGGHDMGIFDMGDKSVRLHYKGVSTSLYSPPLWIIPIAH